jgi:hypothetical protein
MILKVPEGSNDVLSIFETGNMSVFVNTSVAEEISSFSPELAEIDIFDYH